MPRLSLGRRAASVGPHEFNTSDWPDWTLVSGGKSSRRRQLRGGIAGTSVGLAFTALYFNDVSVSHLPPILKIAGYVLMVVYALLYLFTVMRGVRLGHRRRIQLIVALFALGIAVAVVTESVYHSSYLTYAVAATVLLVPIRVSRLIVLATVGGQMLAMYLIDGQVYWSQVWVLFAVGMGMVGFFMLIFTIEQLRAARNEVQSLAVAEERERMARDLHDILGHSLTTITVKAGLARRLLQQGTDLPAVAAEVGDIEDLGRQALADVRATVSNYRTASLPAEVAGARMSLQAAGITPELPRAVDNVAPRLQEVFGYVVRESVTNVIRHSHASRCEIRLGDRWIEVTDDGDATGGHDFTADGNGNGLAGLRERLAAVGGELSTGRAPGGGFRLRAEAPAHDHGTTAGSDGSDGTDGTDGTDAAGVSGEAAGVSVGATEVSGGASGPATVGHGETRGRG